MANSNFIVETGLQVGPLTIFAGNGDVITSGNVSYTGAGIDTFDTITASGNISGINLNTSGTANVAVLAVSGNAYITGATLHTGKIEYTNPAALQTTANTVQPKYYVDVMSVVFGT